jgi:hypothetical protein
MNLLSQNLGKGWMTFWYMVKRVHGAKKVENHCSKWFWRWCIAGLSNAAPAGAMAPVIYFPGALIYSAGFNVNQNVEKKNISD